MANCLKCGKVKLNKDRQGNRYCRRCGTMPGRNKVDRSGLVRVVAPHFVAGLIIRNDTVIDAAPILRWAMGKRRDFVRDYFQRKGWHAEVIATWA